MKNKNIYLDNHSSTQIDERVYKQMIPFLTNVFGNPHSDSHSHGWTSNKFIDLSRSKIAKVINANKEEIFFTSGATESNNLVIKGLAFSQKKKNHIIFFNNLKNNKKEKYPQPNLIGEHQVINAGIALKAFNLIMKKKLNKNSIKKGLKNVEWPGRLQKIYLNTKLFSKKINFEKWEFWFDGGHNKSASQVLAKTFKKWNKKKLYLIFGMLNSKNPKNFLNYFKQITTKLVTVAIKSDSPYYTNKKLYEIAKLNEFNVETAQTIGHALNKILLSESPGRILICGSFYMYKEVSKLLKK